MREYPKPVFDDAHDERQRAQEAKEKAREALRAKVRENFPEVTEVADVLREQFPQARIIWAVEGKHSVGNVPDDVRVEQEEKFGPLVDIRKV